MVDWIALRFGQVGIDDWTTLRTPEGAEDAREQATELARKWEEENYSTMGGTMVLDVTDAKELISNLEEALESLRLEDERISGEQLPKGGQQKL